MDKNSYEQKNTEMEKILIFFVGIMSSIALQAQTHTESLIACDKSYTAKSELQVDNSIKILISDDADTTTKVQFSVKTNDLELFANIFKTRFLTITPATCSAAELEKFLSIGRKLFLNIIAANVQDTASPIAGVLKVKDFAKSEFTYRTINDSGRIKGFSRTATWVNLRILKVSAEINNGFIQNIKAYIEFPDSSIRYFILPFPVGISSVGNFKTYKDTRLIELESPLYPKALSQKERKEFIAKAKVAKFCFVKIDSSYIIRLNNVIDYDYYLGVDRRDYSPAPIEIVLMGGESKVLHKEQTRKLFEAHIYTDFVGLQEDKPNGLVQVDVKKRININTRQRLSKEWIYWLFRSYGWFHYVSPSVTFSKIEQHNRRLILGDLDSVRFNPGRNDSSSLNKNLHRFATPLDIYQYQSLSAGVDFNIFNLVNHDAKYELAFNIGARLGITPLSDSLTKIKEDTVTKTGFVDHYTLNTLQVYPEIAVRFLPEERFNFSLSGKFVYMRPFNPKVQMVSYSKDDNTLFTPISSSWLNVLELLMSVQVNPNSKLFGRLRYTYEMKNSKNNFAQIQVGYSTYILGNK